MLYYSDAQTMVASRVLERLAKYYDRDDIEEIVMNRPEEVWVKSRGGPWTPEAAHDLTYEYIADRVCPVLANINGTPFDQNDIPIVACDVPDREMRFQCIVGNNVRYDGGDRRGVALSIRSLSANTAIDFSSYGLVPGIRNRTVSVFDGFDAAAGDLDLICRTVEAGLSILISGPTSSGKTTFANRVLQLIDHRFRIITVEDARELKLLQPNRVHLIVPRHRSANHVSHNEIIDSLMRLSPDYVVLGELSTSNAASTFSLMGKGHPVMSTVHAGSPDEAMKAFANNMMTNGSLQGIQSIYDALRPQIGCIVQLTKQRRVSDIVFPAREVMLLNNAARSEQIERLRRAGLLHVATGSEGGEESRVSSGSSTSSASSAPQLSPSDTPSDNGPLATGE